MNEKGALVPANLFDKVTYHLHPSFGERATQGMFWSLLVFFGFGLGDAWVLYFPESHGHQDSVGQCSLCGLVFRLEANVG